MPRAPSPVFTNAPAQAPEIQPSASPAFARIAPTARTATSSPPRRQRIRAARKFVPTSTAALGGIGVVPRQKSATLGPHQFSRSRSDE
jgi:hypothetical protein